VCQYLCAGQRSGIARKQDPVGLRERARGEQWLDAECVKAKIAANSGEDRPEVESLVADVDGDHRGRAAKMLRIDLKGFTREEMHGDGIARKRIQHQNIELLEVAAAGFAFECE